jgi:hypothetical protein
MSMNSREVGSAGLIPPPSTWELCDHDCHTAGEGNQKCRECDCELCPVCHMYITGSLQDHTLQMHLPGAVPEESLRHP